MVKEMFDFSCRCPPTDDRLSKGGIMNYQSELSYSKKTISLILPFHLFCFFLLAVLVPILLSSCSLGGAEHVMTLAKLHNLKVAMSNMTQVMSPSEISFPKDPQDFINWMVAEGGFRPPENEKDTPLTDGWGNEMRLEGDWDGYKICSAGPDEEFDTADDMYLAGNWDSEHIIDGVKEMKASAKSLMTGSLKIPFQEPNGYYKITLPGKYSAIKNYDGWRSEITFRYTAVNTVTIIANPSRYGWEPQQEMNNKISELESGMDTLFPDYEVVESKLVNIDNVPGYEIVLQKENQLGRFYEIMSGESIGYSIAIIASGEDRQYIMDTLTEAVQTGLDLR